MKSALTNERVCALPGAAGTLAMSFCELVHYVVVFPSKVPSIVTAVRVIAIYGKVCMRVFNHCIPREQFHDVRYSGVA